MSLSRHQLKAAKLAKINFRSDNEQKFAPIEFQKRKSQFINELSCLLFTHKEDSEIGVIISELIVFTLTIQERYFLDKVYTASKNSLFTAFDLNDYLIILKKIHMLLFQSRCLSDKERLRFYRLERFCIKRYLKHCTSAD